MAKKIEIRVPNLGDISDVEILEIFVSPGDQVTKEDPLLSLETDKAVMEVPSPDDGIIESITVKVGDTISENDVIGFLTKQDDSTPKEKETSDTKAEPPPMENGQNREAPQSSSSEPRSIPSQGAVKTESTPNESLRLGATFHASPSVRKFGRELGADLTQISGTGPKGRITKTDVQHWVKERLQNRSTGSTSIGVSSLPPFKLEDFTKFGQVETITLGRIKKISGNRLQASWQNIPHVTHFDQGDITDLDQFRKDLNQQLQGEGIKITALAFIIKAAVKALQQFPQFNSTIEGDQLHMKKYYNIGFAADTSDGLLVPVIFDADKKGLKEIAAELMNLSSKAREKKLESKYLSGGTFTISSLGGIGGTNFTPVINPPEAAILGVSRSQWSPLWKEEEFVPRLMLPFSLSYDHRIIDGAQAARFCRFIADILTDFRLSAL